MLPLSVYMVSYGAYFIAAHARTVAHLAAPHGDLRLGGTRRPELRLASQTWIFDATPIWYKWFQSSHGTVGLLAIGNPLLWWVSLPCLVVLLLRAWRGRDLRIALLPLVVAALYLPWLATSRQTYIYYLAPVVPFLAVSVAAALSTSREAERQSWRAVLGWFLVGLAAGALVYPLLWLGGHAWQAVSSSLPLTIAAAVVGAGLAVTVILMLARRAPARAAATWIYSGAAAGIAVALLPFLLGLPVAFDYYHRLTVFTAWR